MSILDWEIHPDSPVGLARLELHGTPHTRCCSGVPGDSEAYTKETQGQLQEEAQKVGACCVSVSTRDVLLLAMLDIRSIGLVRNRNT